MDPLRGTASLLTANKAKEHSPGWPHDGKWLAFANDHHSNNEVLVMSSTSGLDTRLTYNSANDLPNDFTPTNSTVLFSIDRL